MDEKSRFFIYLLENYAEHKGVSGRQVFDLWKENNLVGYIMDMYFLYHQERLENAFDDIDSKLVA